VVIGGLFTSTLLTLLVVPVMYSVLDGLAHAANQRGKNTKDRQESATSAE
jgi:hypothetical protein